jgi:hypothetical protein
VGGDDAAAVAAYIAKYASKATTGDFTAAGFPGHFSSKSRSFSATLGALRRDRVAYRQARQTDPWDRPYDPDQVATVPPLRYAGSGHLHPADPITAATNAALTPERAALVREARQDPALSRPRTKRLGEPTSHG